MQPVAELLRWLARAGGSLLVLSLDATRETVSHLNGGLRDLRSSVGAFRGTLRRTGAAVAGVLWGGVVVVWLLAGAVLLRAAGVDDVYGALGDPPDERDDAAGDSADGTDDAADAAVPGADVDPDAVTDERGHFSAALFHRATGLSPSEFLHLFVERNGGRVKQSVLVRCLPWSRGTVSRYLDELEAAGVVERVSIGNHNVVCLREEMPADEADRAAADDARTADR